MMNASLFAEIAALERKKKQESTSAYLISKMENVGYLSGFWGTFGRLLITPKQTLLITDARYAEKAKKIASQNKMELLLASGEKNFWQEVLKRYKIKNLRIEGAVMSVNALKSLRQKLGSGMRVFSTKELVEKKRAQKTAVEIRKIQKAAMITDKTLQTVLPYLRVGVTEQEIAWLLERVAREEYGAAGMSFPPIVAFGKNSAIPHHENTNMKLQKNMPLLIDFGVLFARYASDMTRSFFFGKPTKEWLASFQLVLQAQEKGIRKILVGEKFSAPDSAARRIFGAQEKYFCHSFGHGVGLEIHEFPSISQKAKGKFITGMVVTAEPGLYFAGKFGIRIEDLLLVQKNKPHVLSHFPKTISAAVII